MAYSRLERIWIGVGASLMGGTLLTAAYCTLAAKFAVDSTNEKLDRIEARQQTSEKTLRHVDAGVMDFNARFKEFGAIQQASLEQTNDLQHQMLAKLEEQAGLIAALKKMGEPVPAMLKPQRHITPEQLEQALNEIRDDPEAQKCVVHGAVKEVGNQPDEGVDAYFQVVVNRTAEDRVMWGGRSACGVIHHIACKTGKDGKVHCTKMFTGVSGPEAQWHPSPNDPIVARMKRLLNAYLAGQQRAPEAVQTADHYMNPCFADASNVRGWAKTLKFLQVVGDHYFFRTPAIFEHVLGQEIPSPNCRPGHGHVRLMARAHAGHHHHRYRHKHAPLVAQNEHPGLWSRLFGSAKTDSKKPQKTAQK